MDRKFSQVFRESYDSIVNAVNTSHAQGVPYYILEMMLSNVLQQVQAVAKEEYAQDEAVDTQEHTEEEDE